MVYLSCYNYEIGFIRRICMEKLLEWERRNKFFDLGFEEIKNLCKKFLIRKDKFIVTKAKHGLANTIILLNSRIEISLYYVLMFEI
jgi:hypothetical protein